MTKRTLTAALCLLMIVSAAQAQTAPGGADRTSTASVSAEPSGGFGWDDGDSDDDGGPTKRLGVKENPDTTRDYNCGGENMSPCDDDFAKGCTDGGGKMSGKQPWGGKTCFNAFVHEDPKKDT